MVVGVGAHIRTLRKEKGLTQKQLGERCGMADSAIRFYESDRGNPTHKTLERIASALGVHVFDLIGIGAELDKYRLEYDRIEPISGNPEDLTHEKRAELEKIFLDGPRADYDSLSDKDKIEFWQMISRGSEFFDIDNLRARINAALDQLPEEGQKKVATYAEDLIPRYRYRRQEVPPANLADQDTPSPEPPPESTENGE